MKLWSALCISPAFLGESELSMQPELAEVSQRMEVFGVEHPVAFVTGSGSRRVGRVIAETFLQHGYRVVLHALNSVQQAQQDVARLRARGHDVALVSGHVANEQNVRKWVEQIHERMGRIDVVVNSAAVWSPRSFEQLVASDYEEAFSINVLGPALISQLFGVQMTLQASGGAIIQIGDWATVRPYKDFAHYFISKGAIEAMTATMAVELASRNPRMRVNAVLPGPVLLAEGISQQHQQQIIEHSLLKRAGRPEDVARAVIFLAESPFITGVCLRVDGGRAIYAGPSVDPHAHPQYQPRP